MLTCTASICGNRATATAAVSMALRLLDAQPRQKQPPKRGRARHRSWRARALPKTAPRLPSPAWRRIYCARHAARSASRGSKWAPPSDHAADPRRAHSPRAWSTGLEEVWRSTERCGIERAAAAWPRASKMPRRGPSTLIGPPGRARLAQRRVLLAGKEMEASRPPPPPPPRPPPPASRRLLRARRAAILSAHRQPAGAPERTGLPAATPRNAAVGADDGRQRRWPRRRAAAAWRRCRRRRGRRRRPSPQQPWRRRALVNLDASASRSAFRRAQAPLARPRP